VTSLNGKFLPKIPNVDDSELLKPTCYTYNVEIWLKRVNREIIMIQRCEISSESLRGLHGLPVYCVNVEVMHFKFRMTSSDFERLRKF